MIDEEICILSTFNCFVGAPEIYSNEPHCIRFFCNFVCVCGLWFGILPLCNTEDTIEFYWIFWGERSDEDNGHYMIPCHPWSPGGIYVRSQCQGNLCVREKPYFMGFFLYKNEYHIPDCVSLFTLASRIFRPSLLLSIKNCTRLFCLHVPILTSCIFQILICYVMQWGDRGEYDHLHISL